MTCPKCGVVAEAGTRFCGNCGGALNHPAGHGIAAGPTRIVHEADAVTELPPPVQARDTQSQNQNQNQTLYVGPAAASQAKPSAPEAAPAGLLKAPPTSRAVDMVEAVQASVHALVPPVGQPPIQYTEPRVPVNQVSNLTGPRPQAPVLPLHPETEGHVRSLAMWYQLYGAVALVVCLFLFEADPMTGLVGILLGITSVTAGILLFRCSPMGRILCLLLAIALPIAFGLMLWKMIAGGQPDILSTAVWALPAAVFSAMSLLLLTASNSAEVCTAKYQHLSDQAAHEVLNLSSLYFWVPGVLTGIALVLPALASLLHR